MRTPRMTQYDKFVESLYRENLRGYHELLSMQHGISARLGLKEQDALELAVKIVSNPANGNHKQQESKMPNELDEAFEGMSYDEVLEAVRQYKAPKVEQQEQEQVDELAQAMEAELTAVPRGRSAAEMRAAIRDKYARVRQEGERQKQAQSQRAELDGKARSELVQMYRAEHAKIRRGDIAAMSELKSRYRPVLPDVDQIGG